MNYVFGFSIVVGLGRNTLRYTRNCFKVVFFMVIVTVLVMFRAVILGVR